jgi:chemotaxis protein methyltransferase CheR
MTTASTLSPDALTFVCTLVRSRSAIELEASKAYLIEARLNPVAKKHGFASINELLKSLQTKPRLDVQQQVVEAMTTNETSFFRDAHPFEALRTKLIGEFIKARSPQKTLNIWSAACSTGQEAYSIAILLREHFPELVNWKVNIVGTDLSDDVLEKARAGKFSQIEVNRGLPAALLMKHFARQGLQWELNPAIRGMASFRKLNLIETWSGLPTFDIVFLRNVLIYFAPEVKKSILGNVRKVMAPDGVLFLGAAETTLGLDAAYDRESCGQAVFYRRK